MKKTQPAPAETSGGKQPKKLRPVYFTETRWAALKKIGGNATRAVKDKQNRRSSNFNYSQETQFCLPRAIMVQNGNTAWV